MHPRIRRQQRAWAFDPTWVRELLRIHLGTGVGTSPTRGCETWGWVRASRLVVVQFCSEFVTRLAAMSFRSCNKEGCMSTKRRTSSSEHASAWALHKRKCTHRMGIRNTHDGTMQGSAMQAPQRHRRSHTIQQHVKYSTACSMHSEDDI